MNFYLYFKKEDWMSTEPINQNSMRLGQFEFNAMNNPFRRFFQKHKEFALFKKMLKRNTIDLYGKIIMDAGCGSGYSTKLIIDEFHPLYMFSREELEAGLKHVGLRIVNRKSFLFGYFRSYLCIKDYMLN